MNFDTIEKLYKKAKCKHSAWKMILVFNLYPAWECCECGEVCRELKDKEYE